MLKRYKKAFENTFRFTDLLIITFSFYIAYYLRYGASHLTIFHYPVQVKVFLCSYLIAWIFFSVHFHLYSSKRLTSFWKESVDLLKTTILCLMLAAVPAFYWHENPMNRSFVFYLWPIQIGSLILFRYIVRRFLRYIRLHGYNFRQVLIVGRNQRAENVVKSIEENPEYGLKLLGFIDNPNNRNGSGYLTNCKLLGKIEDLESILHDQVVDEVIVTLPFKSFYSEIEKIVRLCEQIGVELKISTDLFNLSLAKEGIALIGDIQVIDLYTSPKMNYQLIIKRLIDIIVSAILLILFSPVFAIVGILIKTTSKGLVFFRQQRVSYNGRQFSLLKFRTMIENAEELKKDLMALNEMDGPVFKMRNDPRLTKVGRFLRKTSIDELPQLINVLKGEMSLVGPRPPVPDEVSQYDVMTRRRLSMKPGITCIWQISGRNNISFEKWMELDRQYIDQWSLWLDFKILAKTIQAVLRGSGAT